MAKPEQTEKATPKRKREARQRGQVPRSQDIGGSVIFLAIVFALHAGFMSTLDDWHKTKSRDDVTAAAGFMLAEKYLKEAEERVRNAERALHAVWREKS